MTRKKRVPFLFILLPVLVLFLPAPGKADAQKDLQEKISPKPMIIKSKTLEWDDEKKMVTFTGEVNAQKDDFVVDCRKMIVYYTASSDEQAKGDIARGVDRIVATGQVRITRSSGEVAEAEKAVYYQADEKLVLTDHPSVRQGNDLVKGDRIIVFLKENRSIVESTGKERVQAIIFPKTKKKKSP
ncbi:MAG: lipopolysaccharide transport periplasmic protein LptA [Desulfatiglandaceae bacterium]|jgi:lipopolysaccharide export system protein LptA